LIKSVTLKTLHFEVEEGLNEAAQAARNSGESCIHLACNEIGVLRGNEPLSNEIIVIPSISIDSQHGGGGY
ncbi:MAG: hypothetical protein AABY64_10850, partial [Bdellovibrionota bacterium]